MISRICTLAFPPCRLSIPFLRRTRWSCSYLEAVRTARRPRTLSTRRAFRCVPVLSHCRYTCPLSPSTSLRRPTPISPHLTHYLPPHPTPSPPSHLLVRLTSSHVSPHTAPPLTVSPILPPFSPPPSRTPVSHTRQRAVQKGRGVARAAGRAEEQDGQDECPELLGQGGVRGRLQRRAGGVDGDQVGRPPCSLAPLSSPPTPSTPSAPSAPSAPALLLLTTPPPSASPPRYFLPHPIAPRTPHAASRTRKADDSVWKTGRDARGGEERGERRMKECEYLNKYCSHT